MQAFVYFVYKIVNKRVTSRNMNKNNDRKIALMATITLIAAIALMATAPIVTEHLAYADGHHHHHKDR